MRVLVILAIFLAWPSWAAQPRWHYGEWRGEPIDYRGLPLLDRALYAANHWLMNPAVRVSEYLVKAQIQLEAFEAAVPLILGTGARFSERIYAEANRVLGFQLEDLVTRYPPAMSAHAFNRLQKRSFPPTQVKKIYRLLAGRLEALFLDGSGGREVETRLLNGEALFLIPPEFRKPWEQIESFQLYLAHGFWRVLEEDPEEALRLVPHRFLRASKLLPPIESWLMEKTSEPALSLSRLSAYLFWALAQSHRSSVDFPIKSLIETTRSENPQFRELAWWILGEAYGAGKVSPVDQETLPMVPALIARIPTPALNGGTGVFASRLAELLKAAHNAPLSEGAIPLLVAWYSRVAPTREMEKEWLAALERDPSNPSPLLTLLVKVQAKTEPHFHYQPITIETLLSKLTRAPAEALEETFWGALEDSLIRWSGQALLTSSANKTLVAGLTQEVGGELETVFLRMATKGVFRAPLMDELMHGYELFHDAESTGSGLLRLIYSIRRLQPGRWERLVARMTSYRDQGDYYESAQIEFPGGALINLVDEILAVPQVRLARGEITPYACLWELTLFEHPLK